MKWKSSGLWQGWRYSLWPLTWAVLCFGLFLPEKIEAAPAIDWPLLRDAICQWESQGFTRPDEEVSKKGAIGYCQVLLQTVRHLGFKEHTAILMLSREENKRWALEVLTRYCHIPSFNAKGRMVHYGYQTPEGLAWCYNGGKFRGKLNKRDAYVVGVMEIYRAKQLAMK